MTPIPYDSRVEMLQIMLNDFRLRNNVTAWDRIDTDGRFGPETEKAVKAFQSFAGLYPDGRVGDKTIGKFRELSLSPAINNNYVYRNPSTISPHKTVSYERAQNFVNTAYNFFSTTTDATQTVYDIIGIIQKSYTEVMAKHEALYNKVLNNRKLGQRKLKLIMNDANDVLRQFKKRGLTSLEEFKAVYNGKSSRITRKALMEFMSAVAESVKSSKIVVTVSKIMRALRKVVDVLNKIPGLKYLGVIEKIYKGVKSLIRLDCESAFGFFMDGLRDLIESIVVDAIVAAAIASGAFVWAIIIILLFLIVDYLFFSDNPGESVLDKLIGKPVTKNVTTEYVAPWAYKFSQ